MANDNALLIEEEKKTGRKPGGAKTGGRVKGTPNKRTFDARALAERLGVDPLEILLNIAISDHEALGYKLPFVTKVNMGIEYEEDVITMDHRIAAAREAAKYVYPQLKSMELTGKDGANLFAQRLLSAQSRVGTLVGDAMSEDPKQIPGPQNLDEDA